jgi:hypothetical protein
MSNEGYKMHKGTVLEVLSSGGMAGGKEWLGRC